LQPGYPDFDFAVQTGVIEADAVIAADGMPSVLQDHVVERTEPTARNLWGYGGNGKHVLAYDRNPLTRWTNGRRAASFNVRF
jgi:hypothetical protein